jgi:single-strand DNA-binding protein
MPNLNRTQIVGHLGRDVEVKLSKNSKEYATFNMAVTDKQKDGDTWKEDTTWFSVVCFGYTASSMKGATKGEPVYVEGKCKLKEYEKDGVKKAYIEVVADEVFRLQRHVKAEPAPAKSSSYDDDDGMPF